MDSATVSTPVIAMVAGEASGDLLGRLQQILGGAKPAAGGSNGSDGLGTPPTTDRCGC